MDSPQFILHIVYVHGFHGDHTTFQSFPTDLHKALLLHLPPTIDLRSILYPTYKSRRPIAEATQKFLNWLDTLPYGPVILCGHSMGGLLVAEAATSQTHYAAKRVIALLGFDVPFLGMHPHVVISGLASLLPTQKDDTAEGGKDHETLEGRKLKSEGEMNDKKHVTVSASEESPMSSIASTASFSNPLSPPSNSLTVPNPPPLPLQPAPHAQAQLPGNPSPSPATSVVSRTLDLIESHSDNSFFRFVSKHKGDVLGASKRWVVQNFEFGICMFDPKGLTDRYTALQQWQKPWVAYWTETKPGATRSDGGMTVEHPIESGVVVLEEDDGLKAERDATESLAQLFEQTSLPVSTTAQDSQLLSSEGVTENPEDATKLHTKNLKAREKFAKALRKEQKKQLRALRTRTEARPHAPHHFVLRPFKRPSFPWHRWEQVKVSGAKDEVEAHCGLFIRDLNWEYEAFVGRVEDVVRGWIRDLDASTYI